MVPTLKDILNLLDEIAPFSIAEEWDNPGLQVGYPSQEITKILIALDPTISAIEESSDRKVQLLLTHHPLIYKSLSHINRAAYPGDVIFEAFKQGISIVAAHTNLDVAQGGINDILADLFGLQNLEVLQEKESTASGTGLGRIGNLPEPVRLSAMIETVKKVLGTMSVMVVGHGDTEIGRVAVVGGSGGGMVPTASVKGASLLITGDVGHHETLEAETLGLALIDAGHFYTERAALRPFADHFKEKLKERVWDVIVEVYEDEKNPMRYE
ncbi:MAG: Nif3-like dinuclear metal center hexameric protein [Deltaproteobacteria bacterium]|nr:Nif3-like dinuclear metal center hexameric protein [Deltaproteobacteria bacterium]